MSGFFIDPPPAEPGRQNPENNQWTRPKTETWTIPQAARRASTDGAAKQAAPPSDWMLKLIDATFLLMYGTYGLTAVVFKNLAASSVLLCILWIVDTLAWSGLWNLLLTGTLRDFSLLTILAVLLGLLFATAILYYESSFLSANFKKSSYPKIATAMRIVSVGAIAAVTSLPIDMYLLESQINNRIHQEKVLEQLPTLIRQWGSAKQREAGNAETKAVVDAGSVIQATNLEQAKSQLSTTQSDVDRLRGETAQAQGQVFYFERRLTSPRISEKRKAPVDIGPATSDDLSPAERAAMENRLRTAKATLAVKQKALAQKEAELLTDQKSANTANLDLRQTQANLGLEETKEAIGDANRYENWIHDLWNARPKTVVQERTQEKTDPLTYDGLEMEGHSGVGERLIAMADILTGRPPRKPNMSSDDRLALQRMKLTPFVEADAQALEQERADAASLRQLTSACFVLFTFLPFLILAQKGLFEEETKKYFDNDYQWKLGNPLASAPAASSVKEPSPLQGPE